MTVKSNIKVIVIDDEPKMTKLLKLILEDHLDCTVETFNDPHLAYQRLEEEEFDVISLDYRMPGISGMDIVKKLRVENKGINHTTPILIFTGFREEAESLAIEALNDLLFLEKPINDERYILHVKMALAMKQKKSVA